MTILRPLDVIRIHDELIKPPGPKFVICVEPLLGLFLRINTDGWRDGSVSISCSKHTFLKHDSFIECGDPLDPDSFIVDDAVERYGILGRLDPALVPDICKAVMAAATINRKDRLAICSALGCSV